MGLLPPDESDRRAYVEALLGVLSGFRQSTARVFSDISSSVSESRAYAAAGVALVDLWQRQCLHLAGAAATAERGTGRSSDDRQ